MKSEGWGPDPWELVSLLEETPESSVSLAWGHSEKVAICKSERELLPETNNAGTLILDV